MAIGLQPDGVGIANIANMAIGLPACLTIGLPACLAIGLPGHRPACLPGHRPAGLAPDRFLLEATRAGPSGRASVDGGLTAKIFLKIFFWYKLTGHATRRRRTDVQVTAAYSPPCQGH